ETWRIVQPLLDAPPPVEGYPKGSFGPRGADTIVRGYPPWRRPWLPGDARAGIRTAPGQRGSRVLPVR
ncbi:MAG TPA: hypothetical protein VN961_17390, partial [Streptosporangiaceae bacterium]|nr:hypothetical protein [Streptosporangiaceae bacterium]